MSYKDSLSATTYQPSEIGDMKWAEFTEAHGLLRAYNYEKIHILISTDNIVKKYMLL